MRSFDRILYRLPGCPPVWLLQDALGDYLFRVTLPLLGAAALGLFLAALMPEGEGVPIFVMVMGMAVVVIAYREDLRDRIKTLEDALEEAQFGVESGTTA